jgi:hypothetical protein
MSDQPTARSRERSVDAGRSAGRPAAAATRAPDGPRQVSRSRLPLPPVPAASRPAAPRPPAGPRTTAAPFVAVPSPEPRRELAIDDAFPAAAALGASAERSGGSAPAISRPDRTWVDAESALVSTGPSMSGGFRSSASAPRVPRQTTPAGPPSPAYGDWTKPSGSGDVDLVSDDELPARAFRAPAPGTTAIPERRMSGRRRQQVAPIRDSIDHEIDHSVGHSFDEDKDLAPAPVRGPGTGSVVGGRAAMRAERQAADMVRRKAEKRSGSAVAVLDELGTDGDVRKPRRVIKGLLAMTVVALGVLGVYSFVSPETKEAAAESPATVSSAPALIPDASNPLPALPSTPVEVAPAPTTPVRVPVTVLNATETTGLAAKVAEAFGTSGWETPGVGGYTAGDVAASTVFFTEGDETQRQAAVQLVDAFPQLQGPSVRFFELPADVTAPGLVVVLTGDWQP